MKFYVVWSKRKILVATALFVLCAIILGQYYSALGTRDEQAHSNKLRIDYINSLNIQVDETCVEVEEVTIPAHFDDVYTQYNHLQQQAGFNLLDFRGCSVTHYTYRFKDDENTYIKLLVYNGAVIGGDISSGELGSTVYPLNRYLLE